MLTVTAEVSPPDTTPPTGSFLTPTNGQTFYLGQSVPVSVDASDNVGVLEIHLAIGSLENEWDIAGAAPYEFEVTGLPGGSHDLLARIIDTSYNETVVTNPIVVADLPAMGAGPTGDGLRLTWPASWVLEEGTNMVSPFWVPVPGAASPYPVSTTNDQRYYRVRLP